MASGKHKWFMKVRGSYLPSSAVGWLTYIPYTAYLVGVLVFVLNQSYSFWHGLFIVLPNWIAAVAVMNYLAARKS
ncbi:MAG: hypothetical protein JWS12_203 [Candidatus Saccharibacteria bacterium]|nr:hypothetical protein [Candidatus Saccharibacteria bacterium]